MKRLTTVLSGTREFLRSGATWNSVYECNPNLDYSKLSGDEHGNLWTFSHCQAKALFLYEVGGTEPIYCHYVQQPCMFSLAQPLSRTTC